jgi:hypothetical protein
VPDYPTDADKYRILPSWWETEWMIERDRRQAEYIAASEALEAAVTETFDTYQDAQHGFQSARAALLKHMEEHP